MDLRLGIIYKRKKVYFDNNNSNTVYKPIGIGLCVSNNTSAYFINGKYKNQNIDYFNKSNNEIICAFFDIKQLFSYNTDSIDESLKIYWNEYCEGKYCTYSNRVFSTIENKNDIEKCKKAFNDFIPEITDDNTTLDEDQKENQFIPYKIEEKYLQLKEHIYGQDYQLKQILTCLIKNSNLANSIYDKDMIASLKSNILLLGQTGVGKTLIIKQIAKLFNIPYVIEDATRYTRNGWAGEDIENMLRNLYVASDKSVVRAENGILVIDEFDKLCNHDEQSGVSTTAVQQSLLKIIEGTKINLSKTNHTDIGGFNFDTSKLTIILSGAFDGIDKIIEKRTNEKAIGFNNTNVTKMDKNIQIEDLIEYGVISELAGRMSNIIQLNSPNEKDLKTAFLYSKSSSLNLLEKHLKDNGIKVEFEEEFIDTLVEKAITLKTGYRALNQVLNNIVENEMFDIMANKEKVLSLTSEKVK